MTKHTISFWLRSVINEVSRMVSDSDHTVVKVKVHEVRSVGASVILKKNIL